MLQSSYDSRAVQTVRGFFPENSGMTAMAYKVIRETGAESTGSFRPADRVKGKGSKLYSVVDLDSVRETILSLKGSVVTSLPEGCMDFSMISGEYGIEPHVLSSIFSAVGLTACSTYRRNGAKRPVNAYRQEDVEVVIRGLSHIRSEIGWACDENLAEEGC